MPRQNQRSSFGYRFVTCGGPSGVVECGSIRRSRAKYQNMEAVVENPRKVKSPVRPPREAETGRCLRGDGGSTVVQLSEGAHKINQMIETWSSGTSFNRQSKDIAKDLLKGALDLQESLILLGKLQEATKYAAQLKQKAEISKNLQKDTRFQKPRISVDKAQGTYKFCRKEFNSICDVPSTSSSRSSTINGDDAEIMEKGSVFRSNVTAKLLGLEEIEIPSKKKPSLFDVPRLDREQRSLKEILAGMQSKGLLTSDTAGNRKCRNGDHPPIVLIKPFSAPVVKGNEHLVHEERILSTDAILKNGKMKEEIFREFSDGQEKFYRSEKEEVKEYESFGHRSRSKSSGRTKEGSQPKKRLPAQVTKKSPKSDAVDQQPDEVQKVRKNSGRYSEEATLSRKPLPDPQRQYYMEPRKNDSSTPQRGTRKNLPNRRILEGQQTKSSDHSSSLKVRQINVARQKDIRQNEISVVECETLDVENGVTRRIEVDPVTTETTSSTLTSTSVEETNQSAAIFQLLQDSKNKEGDLDSEDHHVILLDRDQHRAFTKWSDEKALLWSDSTFLAHLENLFERFGIYPSILKSDDKNQPRSVLEKLYVDCANELIERKSLQAPWNLQLVSFALKGTSLSLMFVDKFIEEVCDGINDLNGWCEFADGHLSADGLCALLKRDMRSKGIMTGTWELGWKVGFSREEVEHTVIDMEKMVLGWLIEEAIAEVQQKFLFCDTGFASGIQSD